MSNKILKKTWQLVILAAGAASAACAALGAAAAQPGPVQANQHPTTVEAEQARSEVATLLARQSAAWNRGDLDAFTAVYAEDAAFLSTSGVTQGRQEVLARYRRRYPDAKAMGTLTLEILEARPAPGEGRVDVVSVAARWRLAYPASPDKKTAEGLTLIVLHRHGAGWEIVQDASM